VAIWHLGISAFYHDSAAALVCGSTTVAAAQEERFTRKRHGPGFPANAVAYCLKSHGLRISDLAAIVYFENSAEKFARVTRSVAMRSVFMSLMYLLFFLPVWAITHLVGTGSYGRRYKARQSFWDERT
jgi:predicted NodU family carbamoyl transferase